MVFYVHCCTLRSQNSAWHIVDVLLVLVEYTKCVYCGYHSVEITLNLQAGSWEVTGFTTEELFTCVTFLFSFLLKEPLLGALSPGVSSSSSCVPPQPEPSSSGAALAWWGHGAAQAKICRTEPACPGQGFRICLSSWFSSEGNLGAHLAMSRDIFVCHNLGGGWFWDMLLAPSG